MMDATIVGHGVGRALVRLGQQALFQCHLAQITDCAPVEPGGGGQAHVLAHHALEMRKVAVICS